MSGDEVVMGGLGLVLLVQLFTIISAHRQGKAQAKRQAWALRRLEKLQADVTMFQERFDSLPPRFAQLDGQVRNCRERVDETASEFRKALERAHAESDRQMHARVALSDLGLKYPLFLGDWAIDGVLARELMRTIEIGKPKTIVELGSGSSTVIVAATLRRLGLTGTRHIVVDHLSEFLGQTRELMARQGFTQGVEYWHCPLESGPHSVPWYGGLLEKLTGLELDLVLVDGPPGTEHEGARKPALSALTPLLSAAGILLFDDAARPDERSMLRRWAKTAGGFSVDYVPRGKGIGIVKRESASAAGGGV
jgi:predicted O-methyltransferase YrrM